MAIKLTKSYKLDQISANRDWDGPWMVTTTRKRQVRVFVPVPVDRDVLSPLTNKHVLRKKQNNSVEIRINKLQHLTSLLESINKLQQAQQTATVFVKFH